MKKIIYAGILLVSFIYGVLVGKYGIFPYSQIEFAKNFLDSIMESPSKPLWYGNTENRTKVNCASLDKSTTMVVLAFGQSNSANSGETAYTPTGNVYNFYEGQCFRAKDPLLGATGERGSVWTRFGDLVVERGIYKNVLIVPIGVGDTVISEWTPEGPYFQRIEQADRGLKNVGIELTHLIWHQGEADNWRRTTTKEYKNKFMRLKKGITDMGIDAPLYLSIASIRQGEASQSIQKAQKELIQENPDIYQGPDTDLLDKWNMRRDGTHFTQYGLDRFAQEIYHSLFGENSRADQK